MLGETKIETNKQWEVPKRRDLIGKQKRFCIGQNGFWITTAMLLIGLWLCLLLVGGSLVLYKLERHEKNGSDICQSIFQHSLVQFCLNLWIMRRMLPQGRGWTWYENYWHRYQNSMLWSGVVRYIFLYWDELRLLGRLVVPFLLFRFSFQKFLLFPS